MRALIISAALVALLATPTLGSTSCGTHDEIAKQLAGQYQESQFWWAVDDTGAVLEFWIQKETSRWTLIETKEGCILAPRCTCLKKFGSASGINTENMKSGLDNGKI